MTEKDIPKSPEPENQQQRWLKYGANVVLSSVVVIALAVLLIYLAQTHDKRFDTTIGGSQSLRPQTVDFLKGLDKPVKIVAIYPQLKRQSNEQDYYTPVQDLLNDYAGHNKNIAVQMLNPDEQKDDFAKLVQQATNDFGGQVKDYKGLLDDAPKIEDDLSKFGSDEVKKIRDLPLDKVTDPQMQQGLTGAMLTMISIPREISQLKEAVSGDIDQQVPSYKDAVDEVNRACGDISQYLQVYSQVLDQLKANTTLPKEILDFCPDAEQRAADEEKTVVALQDRISKLPPLKELVEFRDQLKTKSIIVMVDAGKPDGGYRILQFGDVWKVPEASRFTEDNDQQPRLNFEAEQEITSSIASLSSGPKPMVVFVRSGGSPVTTASPDGQPGYFMTVADRLKEYNFDVQEKDVGGQNPPAEGSPPEPTDDEMKSAIWIVMPTSSQMAMMGSPVTALLQKHLDDGGSALVLMAPTADDLKDVLTPYGITCDTHYMLVHEGMEPGGRHSTDQIEEAAQANQAVLVMNDYGDHPLATPLRGLGFLTYESSAVTVSSSLPPGVKAKPLLSVPLSPHSWASATAVDDMTHGVSSGKIVFNSVADPAGGHPLADIDNTSGDRLYAGAASEKTGAGRVVVVGSLAFASDDIVNIRDENRPDIVRFPGNAEFFMDSIFWLSHMDSMLAISPHALEVARISDMSPASLAFWRAGVLTAGLPLAVILLGMFVYAKRRD